MVTACKTLKIVTVATGVTLTLSEEEANVLTSILCAVGGIPDAGHPRAHVDAIRNALKREGFGERYDSSRYTQSGSIYINKKTTI